ncbi:MAG: hypothetical protein IPI00_12215 [Flavobacteriales bacterium]|nr:hypothetical protein [Flavobacteriales bacterium]MBK6943204.1 hypothetical protein [Flavobacteriales bacterium]MBK7240913.1 hypothetical protein [Flavobacteriales bacterium]MBK9536265.1 hypothetical protein [Flavobacteriales bacterium]
MTINIGYFAWIAYTPFLVYLKRTDGFRAQVWLLLALIIGWSLVVAKIITPPMLYAFVFMYSVPIALIHLPAFLLWNKYSTKKWAFFVFPAVLTTMEWLQYTFTPFASWGVAAYTQGEFTSIIQVVSLFGMPGLSFLIYWVNVSVADVITDPSTGIRRLYAPFLLLTLTVIYGEVRLDLNKATGKETVKVAAVGTDSEVSGLPLPSKDEAQKVTDQLFTRTAAVANSGAKIVVWNEAANFVLPDDEDQWLGSIKTLALENQIFLFGSYVMPTSMEPFRYANKYVIADPSGAIPYTYYKHQPVPGEPALKGTEALQTFDMFGSQVGGAICYDYDFPYLAAGFGKLKADIVAVPSSDWRGIDPIHTEMAAFRAVEQGQSVIRSTRFGLSAAITPYGEMVAKLSSFDTNDKMMIATLPMKGTTTVYSNIGDLFIYLCMGYVLVFLIMIVKVNET